MFQTWHHQTSIIIPLIIYLATITSFKRLLIKTLVSSDNNNLDLIDYNSINKLTASTVPIISGKSLFLSNDKLEVSSSKAKQSLDQSALKLGELVTDSDNYRFIPHNPNNDSSTIIQNFTNLAWLVYKGKMFPEKNRQYKLSEGDVIKVGNVVLLIKDIHIQKRILKEENIEFDYSR